MKKKVNTTFTCNKIAFHVDSYFVGPKYKQIVHQPFLNNCHIRKEEKKKLSKKVHF